MIPGMACHLPLFRTGIFDSWRSSWRCTSKVPWRSALNPRGCTGIWHLLDLWRPVLLPLGPGSKAICPWTSTTHRRHFHFEHSWHIDTLTHRTSWHARCRWHHILFSLDYTAQTSRVLKQDGQLYSCWCFFALVVPWLKHPRHNVPQSKLRAVSSNESMNRNAQRWCVLRPAFFAGHCNAEFPLQLYREMNAESFCSCTVLGLQNVQWGSAEACYTQRSQEHAENRSGWSWSECCDADISATFERYIISSTSLSGCLGVYFPPLHCVHPSNSFGIWPASIRLPGLLFNCFDLSPTGVHSG